MNRERTEATMNDREALTAAIEGLRTALPSDAEFPAFAGALNVALAAARERLAQLPEKRAGRVELGDHGLSGVFHNVYPAELVERIAKAMHDSLTPVAVTWDQQTEGVREVYRVKAVAVLDALNGETPDERSSRLARQFKDQPGSFDALNGGDGMTDREALAAEVDRLAKYGLGVTAKATIAAARERLGQLPAKCGTCDGAGRIFTASSATLVGVCPACHGSGKVYPAELVLRIEEVLTSKVPWSLMAVAVLDALNGETE